MKTLNETNSPISKTMTPRFYEVYCNFNDMPSHDGWVYNNVRIHWMAANRNPEELLDRIRHVNAHNLTDTPVPEIQNPDEDFDYRPSCIEECFNEAEMLELKRLWEKYPRASSVEICECDASFDYLPCMALPLSSGDKLIEMEYKFPNAQHSILLRGRYRI